MKRLLFATTALLLLGTAAANAQTALNKCTTISKPASYKVTRNLTASGDCLVVGADFVTIDLNGWTLTGRGSGSGIVRENFGRSTVVRNGTITGFENGVRLPITEHAVVENLQAIENSIQGIFVGLFSQIRNNLVNGGVFGIQTDFRATVTDNTVTRTSSVGIFVGSGSLVSGNTLFSNGRSIDVGPESLVSGNAVHNGISATCPSHIIGNSADLILEGAGCTNIDNLNLAP